MIPCAKCQMPVVRACLLTIFAEVRCVVNTNYPYFLDTSVVADRIVGTYICTTNYMEHTALFACSRMIRFFFLQLASDRRFLGTLSLVSAFSVSFFVPALIISGSVVVSLW